MKKINSSNQPFSFHIGLLIYSLIHIGKLLNILIINSIILLVLKLYQKDIVFYFFVTYVTYPTEIIGYD